MKTHSSMDSNVLFSSRKPDSMSDSPRKKPKLSGARKGCGAGRGLLSHRQDRHRSLESPGAGRYCPRFGAQYPLRSHGHAMRARGNGMQKRYITCAIASVGYNLRGQNGGQIVITLRCRNAHSQVSCITWRTGFDESHFLGWPSSGRHKNHQHPQCPGRGRAGTRRLATSRSGQLAAVKDAAVGW